MNQTLTRTIAMVSSIAITGSVNLGLIPNKSIEASRTLDGPQVVDTTKQVKLENSYKPATNPKIDKFINYAKAKREAEIKAEKAKLDAKKKEETKRRARELATANNTPSLSRGYTGSDETFRVTAYTLSENDCGKNTSSESYGVTASGYNLINEDLRNKKIAVDPNVIPLGSKVYIIFNENVRYQKLNGAVVDLNGEYMAVDTGGAIHGNKIDLFVGGSDSYYTNIANNIGVTSVKVYRRN